MDLLHGKISAIYLRYLGAAFGSAMISAVYGVVDMAMVGQYQGPEGTAALAVVAPVWNIIYSLGLLAGIGGGVLFSVARGSGGEEGERNGNEYFSAAFIAAVIFSLLCWLLVVFFDSPMLRFFGAEGNLLTLARQYLLPVKFAVPLFVLNQMLAAFLRNDGSPGLAAAAVLFGGLFNIVGDYIFVFAFDMGIMGAGLATAIGAALTFAAMLPHFFSRQNRLKLVRPRKLLARLRRIAVTGFSTFFIDIAMGILTALFNRQIMKYLGTDALAVYGVIVNISTIVQCCAYSVGQASQPVISINFGAGRLGRIRATLRCAVATSLFFGLVWTAAALAFPKEFIRIFMAPTAEVLAAAPFIFRCYGLSFLLLPLNIFSTYYFQSLMRPEISFIVSVARGAAVSGLLILILPAAAGGDALWFAMPVSELLVSAAVLYQMIRCTQKLYLRGGHSHWTLRAEGR
ncbi:MAG: MATE family efflux transporter [Synergistaceae bacterium]|nr:MATE family efflux transporter [Synergistaceae bacterium]